MERIPRGKKIKPWSQRMFALAEELREDMIRTRELYKHARQEWYE